MREELHDVAGVTLRALVPEEAPRALHIHGLRPAEAPDVPALLRYDRRGHGGSTAPEPYTGTTVEEQAEDAAGLLEALGAQPLTVIGDDLGALIALDLARRHPRRVEALVLHAPVIAALLPDGGDWLASTAADRPPVPADLAALATWVVTRRELRAITVPAAVVTAVDASPYEERAADALADLLPGARRERGA